MLVKHEPSRLSSTIDQREIDSFLNIDQQESILRIKEERLEIGDLPMDAWIRSLADFDKEAIDVALCSMDFIYFCDAFWQIKDAGEGGWIKFKLWPAQKRLAKLVMNEEGLSHIPGRKRVVVPKGRRMGITMLLGSAVPGYQVIFKKPGRTMLLFSLRERDADKLLGEQRFRGSWARLPKYITVNEFNPRGVDLLPIGGGSNRRKAEFTNGSVIWSMNPREGDGEGSQYTFIDEADFLPELDKTMQIVNPATERGTLVLVSRTNKAIGNSIFQNLARNAMDDPNTEWETMFIPWFENPYLDEVFYEQQKSELSIDDLYSNYPKSIEESLAPAQEDKRIPVTILQSCRSDMDAIEDHGYIKNMVRYSGLKVYKMPNPGEAYYIGADTAEGDERSDNSSTFVVNSQGEDVANITGKYHPKEQALQIRDLSKAYNNARALVEKNFHGFHTISWLEENGFGYILLRDINNKKPGWTTTRQSKESLYINLYELASNNDLVVNDPEAYKEILSIDRSTLKAPKGWEDDRSMAYALAQMARVRMRNKPRLRSYVLSDGKREDKAPIYPFNSGKFNNVTHKEVLPPPRRFLRAEDIDEFTYGDWYDRY